MDYYRNCSEKEFEKFYKPGHGGWKNCDLAGIDHRIDSCHFAVCSACGEEYTYCDSPVLTNEVLIN